METGLSVALFPMVIIAMTIERMSVVWEERGAVDAMRAGLGSLFVAIAAYIFMGMAWLEHLIFTFPELLLVVLALVVLAGRYTGYRLTELRRFKALSAMMFSAARQLREDGVLGLNERNADFIMRLNPRRFYPRVDDKALTKELALEAGMAVPDLYGIIEHQGQVRQFADMVGDLRVSSSSRRRAAAATASSS